MSAAAHDLTLLLRLRLRLLLRWTPSGASRRSRVSNRSRFLIVLLFVVIGLPGLSSVATAMFGSVLPGQAGRAFLVSTLAWGLSMMTFFILFYAVVALTAILTYGGDLQLLLLTPVSPRLFLTEKLLSVSLGFGGLMLLTTPGVIGLGHSLQLGPLYDLTAMLMVLLVPIGPVSLAMLVVVGVLRRIPPARARTLATVLGFVLGALMVVGTQLLFSSEGQNRPDLPGVLPTTWPGHALAAVGLGETQTAITYLLATMLLAAALFGLAIHVAARFFATGWATYQEIAQQRIGRSAIGSQVAADRRDEFGLIAHDIAEAIGPLGRADSTRPAWWPIFEKEWLSLRRDPQRVAMLAYPVILAAISSYQILSKVNTQQGGDVGPVLDGTLYGMLAFVAILMLGSITAATVNGEGRSIYVLALAPLTSRDVLMAKWAICAVPALAIVETILVTGIVFLHVALGQALVAALALAILVVALAALGLLINLLWPRLDVENPRLKASLTATIVSLACEMLVGLIATTLLILALAWWPDYPAAAALAGLALLLVTGCIIGGALVLGPRLLQHLMTGDRY